MAAKKDLIITDSVLDDLLMRRDVISQMINLIHKKIMNAPEGSLRIIKKWKSYQYYQRTTKKDIQGKYIPRSELRIAAALAQKDYDSRLLAELEKQLKAIDRFLKDYDPGAPLRTFDNLAEPRKQLVTPEFAGDEEYVKRWLSVTYQGPGFKKDAPEFYTDKGERVRSKSEVLIANELFRHKIPYRYEFPVYSNGVILAAPDFNCLNVRLRKEFYWEHLGMMGSEDYANRNAAKIEKYTLAKDFDEAALILTFETDRHPLNTRVVAEKIRRFLV